LKYLKGFLYTFFIIIVATIISTTLYYYNIIGDKINNMFLYLISIVSIFIGSIIFNKNTKYKKIIGGLIYFIICMLIYIIISLMFYGGYLNIKSIVYYFVLLIFSVFGSIIGKSINKKSND